MYVCCCEQAVITSEPLGQRQGVHRWSVVGRVLGLSRLLVQVVHGTEGVHGVERVAVHTVVLHGEGLLPETRRQEDDWG